MNDRMTVGPDTRFSDIYQQFQTTGRGGDKHIRFQDAKGLYLSQKASMAKVKDFLTGSNQRMQARMDKRADGAEKIKQAIDREYGQGYGDRIFRRVHEQHGIQLGRGVRRADLGLIDQAIQLDRALPDRIPQGMQINPDGTVGGQSTITHTVDQPQVTLGQALQEKAAQYLHPKEFEYVEGQSVYRKAKDDMPRMNIEIQRQGQAPFSTYRRDFDESVGALRDFAGSDEATTVLSAVLNQYMLRPLYQNMQRGDGTTVDLALAPSQIPVTLRTDDDRIVDIGLPKQFAAADITLSKDEIGNFRVSIEWPLYFTGVRERETRDTTDLPLHENGVLRANFSTSWVINASDAAEGRLSLAVVTPLQVSYQGKLS